jgi:beta-galactosidase
MGNTMLRRTFLKTGAALAAATTLAPLRRAFAASAPPAPRSILPINRGWRFAPHPVAGFEKPEFDDSAFQRVAVPHANKLVPWHGFDEHETQFISSYRRRFRLPASSRGKRVFVDFEGSLTATTVWLNGQKLGEYRGGFTPFSFELTPHLTWTGENILAVQVDSIEQDDIPPFGNIVDYLTFGGLYREVSLRVVDHSHIDGLFIQPVEVLSGRPGVQIQCEVTEPAVGLSLEAELRDGERVVARTTTPIVPASEIQTLRMEGLEGIALWDLDTPHLYEMIVRVRRGAEILDEDKRRFGFRQAVFTPGGFTLNGRTVKLRGLNRHQTFPFAGAAMPARVQRQDALILKRQLKVNIVRTSHYPQSRHFLDCCDEIGLLVLEEIPGWQHIGDEAWKERSLDNLTRMIRRDRNHPAIILWGVRINESPDDHDFYVRTNALAHKLDASRQTGGIRTTESREFQEDVFTINDFGSPLMAPQHPGQLNTEFIGHTFPTKSIDTVTRLTEHMVRHARTHDQLAGDPAYAGGLGWCAFDYNTHANFGSGDHICYHGVSDIFREPKPAAGFYRSQCEPAEEIVLEPAFHWSTGDDLEWLRRVMVCSNCEQLRFYLGTRQIGETGPDRAQFPHLKYPPFTIDLFKQVELSGEDLRIEGYIGGKAVISRTFSGKAVDRGFELRADSQSLAADGTDTTRVVFRVTDEYGELRPYATGAVALSLSGPATLIGENPFALWGGLGAVWIRAGESAGQAILTARHPTLGSRKIVIDIQPAPPEPV